MQISLCKSFNLHFRAVDGKISSKTSCILFDKIRKPHMTYFVTLSILEHLTNYRDHWRRDYFASDYSDKGFWFLTACNLDGFITIEICTHEICVDCRVSFVIQAAHAVAAAIKKRRLKSYFWNSVKILHFTFNSNDVHFLRHFIPGHECTQLKEEKPKKIALNKASAYSCAHT